MFLTWKPLLRDAVIFGVVLFASQPSRADVFVLTTGGQVEGELLNADESPRQTYVVKTDLGATITLDKSQIKERVRLTDLQKRYESFAANIRNTVEDHWNLAERCRQAKLDAEREFHLREVLKLDPDHKEARYGLGYHRKGDRWVTTDELAQSQGYVRYKGTWRLPQDIDLIVAREQAKQDEITWRKEVRRLRNKVDDRNGDKALEELRAIRNPAAASAIAELLSERNERRELREMYIDLLAKMESPVANHALMQQALFDERENLRDRCLDHLANKARDAAIRFFAAKLKDENNTTLNRAAVALGRLGETDITPQLIDVLQTQKKVTVGGNQGQISPVFDGSGGGGLSMGGSAKQVTITQQNSGVLAALTSLNKGINFSYDQAAWRVWYAEKNTPKNVKFRRDN